MKKSIIIWALLTIIITLFSTLTPRASSSEEALTPEKLSGIWAGRWSSFALDSARGAGLLSTFRCQILITPNLTGIISCSSTMRGNFLLLLDVPGEIIDNQLVIRDPGKPSMIRMKVHMTGKNKLEGECTGDYKGDLTIYKKVRDLKDEEKQRNLSQLQDLL
jgi:hypothetical protein